MKEWEKRIGMADAYGTTAEVWFYPAEDDDPACMGLTLGIGQSESRTFPTTTAARQLAAALLDAAEAVDVEDGVDEPKRDIRPGA